MNFIRSSLVALQSRIQHCLCCGSGHCYGVGSILGLGIFPCCGPCKKKKEDKNKKTKLLVLSSSISSLFEFITQYITQFLQTKCLLSFQLFESIV